MCSDFEDMTRLLRMKGAKGINVTNANEDLELELELENERLPSLASE